MADDDRITLVGINERLSDYLVQGLEGIRIQGGIGIELDMAGGDGQVMAQHLGQEFPKLALMLFDFSRSMGYSAGKI